MTSFLTSDRLLTGRQNEHYRPEAEVQQMCASLSRLFRINLSTSRGEP